jgi:hypothetical protein
VLPAIRAAILNVPDVIDAYVTDNSTASPRAVGAVTIAANSLYVAVVGGTDADVARAIWGKKNPGCAYTGNTTVNVQDTTSGYGTPYPTYPVTFMRPAALPIYIDVQLVSNTGVPNDAALQVQAAVTAAFNGQDGQPRARIGATIYASRFFAGIAALGSWAQILDITIGTAASPTGSSVAVGIGQVPTITASRITVELA